MRSAHDIIAMLPDDVHAEVIEGEVIVNAATPAGRHAKIVLAVRRAFARHGIDNLFENTTLLVEHDQAEYVPDLARWPEHLIEGDTWEFPAAECAFALEVVSDDRPGRRQRDYQKALGYAQGGVPVFLLIDPVERTCTLFTEPRAGEYSVRQIVKFGESLFIPAGDSTVETQVVRLAAAGCTNRGIADRLFVSPHTVNTHLRHVFDKLDIRSRVDLTRVVERHP